MRRRNAPSMAALRSIGLLGLVSALSLTSTVCCSQQQKSEAGPAGNDNRPRQTKSKAMNAGATYMKMAQLNKQARIATLETISESNRQSLPIPVIRAAALHIDFLYYPSLLRPAQPVKLYPPRHRASVDPHSGKLGQVTAVTATDFGLKAKADEEIGGFGLPAGMSADDYTQKLDRLFALYDLLLPPFAAGALPNDAQTKRAAAEFQQLFQLLSEPPLLEYYQAAGRDFFPWVVRVAQ